MIQILNLIEVVKKKVSKAKKDLEHHLTKKENLEIRENFLKIKILENQVLKIRENSSKKKALENQILKIKKNLLVILITQNFLTKQLTHPLKELKIRNPLLKVKKSLKIENDLKIFHLKGIKEIVVKITSSYNYEVFILG